MKTPWKSCRLIYKCSNLALFCCQVSNSFRPWHRALIEGVIFLKCINAVYVIFFSYVQGTLICDVRTLLKECLCLQIQKRLPVQETVGYQKHIFLPDGILLSIGHFHNNVILLLLPASFRVLPCWQIRAFVVKTSLGLLRMTMKGKTKNRILVEVIKSRHRVNGLF